MAGIRAEIDRTVKMLPRDTRLRVVDASELDREGNGRIQSIIFASLSSARHAA